LKFAIQSTATQQLLHQLHQHRKFRSSKSLITSYR
jgi:hypothetical protein